MLLLFSSLCNIFDTIGEGIEWGVMLRNRSGMNERHERERPVLQFYRLLPSVPCHACLNEITTYP